MKNKSVAPSNEGLIKSGNKPSFVVLFPPYYNQHIWDFFSEGKQLSSHSKCNHNVSRETS